MEKVITIITPAYNAECYIERLIKSVLGQTYKDIQFIIVDDGSTDRTPEICDSYSKEDSRMKVIHKKNEGVSKARNMALKNATGEYILFADADDWLEETMCAKMMETAIKNDLDIVISGYKNYYEDSGKFEQVILKEYSDMNFIELITNEYTKYGGFPWNKLMKRKFITTLFDENVHYYENLLFFLKNFNSKTKFGIIKEPIYNYCINPNSAVHSQKFNIKKITALTALENVISLLTSRECIDEHKVAYLENYFICKHGLRKDKNNMLPKDKMKEYFKDVLKSSTVDKNKKVKILIKYYFPNIYYIIKNLKIKKEKHK